MTICELSTEQMTELKQTYLDNHLLETENRTASYNELANANELVPDWIIFDAYQGTYFTNDDFCCTAGNE